MTTHQRTVRKRMLAAVAAGGLLLAACGEETDEPQPQNPGSDTTPTVEEPEDVDEEPTETDAPGDDATGDDATETDDDAEGSDDDAGTTEPSDDGDDPGDDVTDEIHAEATEYVTALVAEDWESAYAMLSPESVELLELDGPADLADEPWMPELLDNLSSDTPVIHDWIAWPETYSHERAIAVTAGEDPDGYAHAFGIRLDEADQWVIDQSRTDVSTGGTWVEFNNPTWDGVVDPDSPIEFRVDATDVDPVAITLHSDTSDELLPTTWTGGNPVPHIAEETPEGHGILVVSGAAVDNPMVRVHLVVPD